jgi:hypothetical protein
MRLLGALGYASRTFIREIGLQDLQCRVYPLLNGRYDGLRRDHAALARIAPLVLDHAVL